MKFPQEFIERVRESSNIVDIISPYVQLRRTGSNHQGLCPFHNEKSGSFSVSEDKQVYHCFGCKASGNVYTFVQNYQGMTFPEAVEYLAKRAGLPLPEVSRGETQRQDTKQTMYRVNALAMQFYHEQLRRLPDSHEVRQYLVKRGLNEELVNLYKLGYAPDDWSKLSEFFETKRVPMTVAEQLGLVKRRTGGKTGHFDMFRHRLMFPIFSATGQCLGFGGRVFGPDQQPKYLNSPDSPAFHKGKVFYGLDTSAKYIRAEDEAIVVEGYMDWLALAKHSINNIVATLGTALTHDHAKVIKRYTDRVLLLFDGDTAGINAATRSLPILLNEGLHARGLFLPDQLDPDEYLQEKGSAALRSLIAGAPDLFDLVTTQAWLQHKGSASGQIQLMDEIAPVLAQTTDLRLRALYIRNFSNMLNVESRLVEQSVKKALAQPNRVVSPQATVAVAAPKTTQVEALKAPVIDLKKAPNVEVELLNVILLKEVYLQEAIAADLAEQFSHPGVKAVFKRILEVYRQMPNKFDSLSALLADEVSPAEIITRHLSGTYTGLTEDAARKLLHDCIKRVKQNYLRLKSRELVSGLRGTVSANPTDQLEQIMNIQNRRKSLDQE